MDSSAMTWQIDAMRLRRHVGVLTMTLLPQLTNQKCLNFVTNVAQNFPTLPNFAANAVYKDSHCKHIYIYDLSIFFFFFHHQNKHCQEN